MNDHAHAEDNDLAHVASARSLLTIFFLLLILTGVTVWAATLDFGAVDLWVAMIIATIKASLVALYFMHLRYDKPFNAIVFLSSFLFVSVFIGFTLMDSFQYEPNVIWEEKIAPAK